MKKENNNGYLWGVFAIILLIAVWVVECQDSLTLLKNSDNPIPIIISAVAFFVFIIWYFLKNTSSKGKDENDKNEES